MPLNTVRSWSRLFLFSLLLSAANMLVALPCRAGGVEDYLYDWSQMQKTDPNGFYLMCGGIGLMVFLSLTILAGFIYYLYKAEYDR